MRRRMTSQSPSRLSRLQHRQRSCSRPTSQSCLQAGTVSEGRPRGRAGFTLAETLAALAVMVVLSGLVLMGVNAAVRIYHQENFSSQAQILSDTANTALSDAYRYITFTEQDGTVVSTVSYLGSTVNGDADGVALVADGGRFYLRGADGSQVRLLNAGAYGGCSVSVDSFSCTSDLVQGTYTVTDDADPSLTRSFSFTFAPLGNVGKDKGTTDDTTQPDSDDHSTIERGRVLPTDAEKAYCSTLLDSWNADRMTWVSMTDGQGTQYYALKVPWGDVYTLAYYDHVYYRCMDADGHQVITPLPSQGDNAFRVSDLTDGARHNYGWSDGMTWEAVQ